MTEIEFRARHSELIEYYQYIEMHLKGICASFPEDENRTWFDMLDDYESDPFGKLLLTIQKYQNEKKLHCFQQKTFLPWTKSEKNGTTGFIGALQETKTGMSYLNMEPYVMRSLY